jgi:hypothetical protein
MAYNKQAGIYSMLGKGISRGGKALYNAPRSAKLMTGAGAGGYYFGRQHGHSAGLQKGKKDAAEQIAKLVNPDHGKGFFTRLLGGSDAVKQSNNLDHVYSNKETVKTYDASESVLKPKIVQESHEAFTPKQRPHTGKGGLKKYDASESPVKSNMKEKTSRCWTGYEPVPGKEPYTDGSCRPASAKKKEKKKMKKASEYTPFEFGYKMAEEFNEKKAGVLDGVRDFAGSTLGGAVGGGLAGGSAALLTALLANRKPIGFQGRPSMGQLGQYAAGGALAGAGLGAGAGGVLSGARLGKQLATKKKTEDENDE